MKRLRSPGRQKMKKFHDMSKKMEHATIDIFKEVLRILDTSVRVNIVPYAKIWNPITRTYNYYAFLEQEITGVITPYSTTVSYENTPSISIADELSNSSFGLLKPRSLDQMDVYLMTIGNMDTGDMDIDNRYTPIVLVELDIDNESEMNRKVTLFVEYTRERIMKDRSSDYSANMIYVSISDLFYLVRGTDYPVIDSKGGENLFDVSRSMFFDEFIQEAYRPKSGDVPVQKVPTEGVNFPFSSVLFKDVTADFKSFMYSLMINEDPEFPQPFPLN
jgi:hypothetical protein